MASPVLQVAVEASIPNSGTSGKTAARAPPVRTVAVAVAVAAAEVVTKAPTRGEPVVAEEARAASRLREPVVAAKPVEAHSRST